MGRPQFSQPSIDSIDNAIYGGDVTSESNGATVSSNSATVVAGPSPDADGDAKVFYVEGVVDDTLSVGQYDLRFILEMEFSSGSWIQVGEWNLPQLPVNPAFRLPDGVPARVRVENNNGSNSQSVRAGLRIAPLQ